MFAKASRFILSKTPLSAKLRPLIFKATTLTAVSYYGLNHLSKQVNYEESFKTVELCGDDELAEGQMKQIVVGPNQDNDVVLLVRLNGQYYTVGAKCSHFGGSLSKGLLFADRVYCPLHLASFSVIDGTPDFGPVFKGIPVYKTQVKNGKVVAELPQKLLFSVDVPARKGDLFQNQHFVIIGGGPAGLSAAETLRHAGFGGKITMLSAEHNLPYDRTILTKNIFKAEVDKLKIRDAEFFKKHDIEVVTDAQVISLDDTNRRIITKGKGEFSYDKVLITTGGSARKANIDGAEAEGVFSIRSFDDLARIQEFSKDKDLKDVVSIGKSFIAVEAASCVKGTFPNANVTLLSKGTLMAVFGSEVSNYVDKLATDNGVKVIGDSDVERIVTENGKVKAVLLKDGREMPAELVIYGFGTIPNTGFLPSSFTDKSGYVNVNQFLESTTAKNVFAAGDVARLLIEDHKPTNVQHYTEAINQGSLAAWNMLEKNIKYDSVPFFWTRMFNKSILYTGINKDTDEIVLKGKPEEHQFVGLYCQKDRCHGAFGTGSSDQMITINQALRLNIPLKKEEFLEDDHFFRKLQVEIMKNIKKCDCKRTERNEK